MSVPSSAAAVPQGSELFKSQQRFSPISGGRRLSFIKTAARQISANRLPRYAPSSQGATFCEYATKKETMKINEVKAETAKALGVSESELGYITEDLLREFQANAKPADTANGGADGQATVADNWGTYGNTITFSGNLVYWKQGPKGTPNYGCGTSESWSAGKDWCKWIIEKGTCSGATKWKFLGNYQG